MKRLICLILSLSLILSTTVFPAFAAENTDAVINSEATISEFESAFPAEYTYNTLYTDENGNEGYIEFEIIGNKTYVQVYVNDVLTQRAYSSPDDDLILWVEYTATTRTTTDLDVESCAYSDMISDVTFENTEKEEEPESYSAVFILKAGRSL